MSIVLSNGEPWKMAMVVWLTKLKSAQTRETYKTAWKQLMQFVDVEIENIQYEHIVAWRQTMLAKELSHGTINLKLAAITSFYEFVQDQYPQMIYEGWTNPAKKIPRMPVNPYGKATFLDENNDLKLLLSIDRSTIEGKRDFAMILMFLATALRNSAVTTARRKDLHKKVTKTFLRYNNKGGKVKDILLPPLVVEALNEYLATRTDNNDALFLQPSGKPMRPRETQKMVKRRCNAAFGEGHGIKPHSLRHTAAMHAIRNGTIADVAALLSHADPRITLLYIQHLDTGGVEKTVNTLADRYG